MSGVVDDIRGFNRFYTRVLGLLRPDLAGSAFGLTEARVLFELAHRDDVAVSDLRRDLDLDAGYLSRILSGFTASGLVARQKSAADGRRQVVRLTPTGPAGVRGAGRVAGGRHRHACWRRSMRVNDRSSSRAMGRIRRMLGDEPPSAASFSRRPRPATSAGWSSGTAPDTRPSTAGTRRSRRSSRASWPTSASVETAKREAAWIAELDGERVGCVFCTAADSPAPRSCGCCSSSRRRAAPASAPGWWTNACASPGDPATAESCCGPTMCWCGPADLPAGRLPARPPRAATTIWPRSGRRVLVARPVMPVRRLARRPTRAGCRASWPAAARPSSPSCGCRWAGN